MPDQTFPYDLCSPSQKWSEACAPDQFVDAQGGTKFCFDLTTPVGSCGSCFATRIALELRRFGMNYVVTEPGPPVDRQLAADYGYWPLSARFGNVYTSLQLVQLIERAFGHFAPAEPAWRDDSGNYRDPFRPHIQPRGFESQLELANDRESHYAAVRSLFETVGAFIVTLGLTDVWTSTQDGAAFPRCPGRGIGSFDRNKYTLRSLDVAANVANLERFLTLLSSVNPGAKIILSVSPVHLLATTTDVHVARASVYAKANLRAAIEAVVRSHAQVDYFASYEIVTLPQPGPSRYAPDRRHASDEAIADVVQSFFANFMKLDTSSLATVDPEIGEPVLAPCDEEELLRLIATDSRE